MRENPTMSKATSICYMDTDIWSPSAACENMLRLFYSLDPKDIAKAKTVCRGCTVRRQCLAFATETNQPDGIWGGMTALQRQRPASVKKQNKLDRMRSDFWRVSRSLGWIARPRDIDEASKRQLCGRWQAYTRNFGGDYENVLRLIGVVSDEHSVVDTTSGLPLQKRFANNQRITLDELVRFFCEASRHRGRIVEFAELKQDSKLGLCVSASTFRRRLGRHQDVVEFVRKEGDLPPEYFEGYQPLRRGQHLALVKKRRTAVNV